MNLIDKKNVLIAGGSGLIGKALAKHLHDHGFNISILTRYPEKIRIYKGFFWNPAKLVSDQRAFIDQDYIINLAGESIAGKFWTKKRKKLILQSRTSSIKTIASALGTIKTKLPKIINTSAIGFYGNKPYSRLTEQDSYDKGFLSNVCQLWEKQATSDLKDVIIIRIGIVLANNGGYLPKIQSILRTRINVIFGSGDQIISWIHIDDLTKAIHSIMLADLPAGIYNLCSPSPVSAKNMQLTISRYIEVKPLNLKIPALLVKIFLRDMSEIFLNSQFVVPENLLKLGFKFQYADLSSALSNLKANSKK